MTCQTQRTIDFFRKVKKPGHAAACVQIGCHLEEVAEMLEVLGEQELAEKVYFLAAQYKRRTVSADHAVARVLESSEKSQALADAMGDQYVTSLGVMHFCEFDAWGIVEEINRSNESKFVDGFPTFDKYGKLAKGPNYSPPNLKPFM